MEDTEFEWDDEKAESNLKKHGVSFDEAATIFNDPNIATILDPDHSEHEERFVSIGSSVIARLLTVIHTFRKNPNSIDQRKKGYEGRKETI